MALWILLLFVGSSRGVYYGLTSNYYPTTSTDPKNPYPLVELHSVTTTDECSVAGGTCLGVNCTLVSTATERVDPNSDDFCRTKTTTVLQVSTDAPFEMSMDTGSLSWVDNNENVKLVRALALVDLRTRSPGGPLNHPPQAAVISPLRIPLNCARQMPLLAFDPNGDQVLCRFASNPPFECDPCTPSSLSPYLTLAPTCILSLIPSLSTTPDLYVIDLVMEDYYREDILYSEVNFTRSNGTSEAKGSSDVISRVPLQFILNLTSSVPSCTEGVYVPKFVAPTPEHGTQFYVFSGQQQIVIQAEATAAAIEGLLFSGPANVTEEAQGNGRFVLTWTPPTTLTSPRSYPLCFVARADVDSEIRCVILRFASVLDFQSQLPTGTVFTYYPSSTNGSMMVTFRAKFNRKICFSVPEVITSYRTFTCVSGDCGSQTLVGHFPVDSENNGEFCQTETVFTLNTPSTSVFQAEIGFSRFSVDLRTRSDTGRPNRPPLTAVPPTIRIPNNCGRDFKILAFDEDGDEVKLCLSNTDNSGCLSCSFVTSHDTKYCPHSFTPTFFKGQYQIATYIKDFPKQNVILTHTNGSQEVRTPNDDISGSFASVYVQMDAAAPSCDVGKYLPEFTSDTPEFGEIFTATAGETLLIEVSAVAKVSKVSELLFSGPHEMEELTVGEGQFQLQWTPSEAEVGQSHPVCFLVDAVVGSHRYQTEPRCVVVKVASTDSTTQLPATAVTTTYSPTNATIQPPTTEPPTTTPAPSDAEGDHYVAALNVGLTSVGPLTEADMENFLALLKSTLVALGLPPETNLKTLSVSPSGEN